MRSLTAIIANPDHIEKLSPKDATILLGELEGLRAMLWARLLAPRALAVPEPPPRPVRDDRPAERTDPDQLLTLAEVASILGTGKSRVYALMQQRDFPGVIRFGRSVRIERRALQAWIDEHR